MRSFLSATVLLLLIHSSAPGWGQKDVSEEGEGENESQSRSLFEVSPGLENLTRGSSLQSANYLYLSAFFNASEHLSIGGGLESDLIPSTFENRIARGEVRFTSSNTRVDTRLRASLLYLKGLSSRSDHIGVKVCLLSHQDKNLSVDFLPITITYQLGTGDIALIYELIGFGVRF